MTVKFLNDYGTNLAANITSSATTLTVSSGTGQAFLGLLTGGDVYYMTLIQVGTQGPFEIIQVTAVAGDTLTVVRAQDGTSARAWNLGDALENRIPRVVLNLLAQTGGGALGTMATQNANAVNITGGTIIGITDLAVADGGTGASTAALARTNLGAAASGANTDITSLAAPALGAATATTATPGDNSTLVATTAFVTAASAVTAATQAQQETATSTSVFTSPGTQQYHPGMPKAWLRMTCVAGVVSIIASYNIASLVRNSAGNFTVTFTKAFSSATNYGMSGQSILNFPPAGNATRNVYPTTFGTGTTCTITTTDSAGTVEDNHAYTFVQWFGDQ